MDQPYPGAYPSILDISWTRRLYVMEIAHESRPGLAYAAAFPYFDNSISNRTTRKSTRKTGGGDLYGTVRWQPFESVESHEPHGFLTPHNLALTLTVSLPTGDERNADSPALHFGQLGSGSVDARAGASYAGSFNPSLGAYASAVLTVDGGPDTNRFRNGNIGEFKLGLTAKLGPVSFFAGGYSVWRERNYQGVTSGTSSQVLRLTESGGTWVFAEGGLRATHGRFFVEGAAAVPVYRRVNNQQPVSNTTYSVGAGSRM